MERMKYVKIPVVEMLEIAKDITKLQKYIDEAKQCIVICEYCGKEFFTIRPDSAKYCDKCNANSIAVKKYAAKNPEQLRKTKREWARRKKEKLKGLI